MCHASSSNNLNMLLIMESCALLTVDAASTNKRLDNSSTANRGKPNLCARYCTVYCYFNSLDSLKFKFNQIRFDPS